MSKKETYFRVLQPEINSLVKGHKENNNKVFNYIISLFVDSSEISGDAIIPLRDNINEFFNSIGLRSVSIYDYEEDQVEDNDIDSDSLYSLGYDYVEGDSYSDDQILALLYYFFSGEQEERPVFIEDKNNFVGSVNEDLERLKSAFRVITTLHYHEDPDEEDKNIFIPVLIKRSFVPPNN